MTSAIQNRLLKGQTPPSRPQSYIPMCGSRPASATSALAQAKKRFPVELLRYGEDDPAVVSQAAPINQVDVNDGISKPPDTDLNKVTNTRRQCESFAIEGVIMTCIDGWEDEENPFEPITMMNLLDTPKIKKRHHLRALRRHAMYFVRLENVHSPSNFSMEFVMPSKPGCSSWDDWDRSLQQFYNAPGVAEKYKLKTFRPYKGQMYAVYSQDAKKWERVRVHHFNGPKLTAAGYYLDRSGSEAFHSFPFPSFYELHPDFGRWNRCPLKGTLADIKPCNYDEASANQNVNTQWPQDVIEYFEDCTKDKLFRAFIVNKGADKNSPFIDVCEEGMDTHVSVILFEVGGESEIPVNARLLQKGYAVPFKSMVGYELLLKELHGVKVSEERKQEGP